jgi:hypothetical protein
MTQGWEEADYFSIFSDNRKRTVRKRMTSRYYELQPLFAQTTKDHQAVLVAVVFLILPCEFREAV